MASAAPITIVDYNPAWPELFLEEAHQIAAILGPELVNIHHVGSTSIHYMPAKPVIDLLAVVKTIDQVDGCNPQLQDLGYQPKGECGIPGRRYFTKDNATVPTHHLHVWPQGHHEITRTLDFRDFLNVHGQEAQEYAELKIKLAQRFPRDSQSYSDGKSAFIRKIELRAKRWRQAQRSHMP